MNNFKLKRINYRFLVGLIVTLLFITVLDANFFVFDRTFEYVFRSCDIIEFPKEYDFESDELYMYTFDVGQSDSILLLYQDTSILIDSSTTDYAYPLVKTLKSLGINKLDYCIFTHPHYDHMGGASAILRTFEPTKTYITKYDYNKIKKWWFKVYEKTVAFKDIDQKYLIEGQTITIDELNLQVIAPISNYYEHINDYSLGLKVTLGETDILLLGDIEAASEHDLIESDYDLNAEILKVAHHGSTTSSTLDFLRLVQPNYSIISVGENNPYDHPRDYTLSKLQSLNSEIFRTDLHGTILVTTDGKSITIHTSN